MPSFHPKCPTNPLHIPFSPFTATQPSNKKSKYEGCLKSMPRQYTSEMNNKELFWHTLS